MASPTIEERMLKLEQDATNARAEAAKVQAVQSYNVMMGNIEDPSEDEEDEEDE